MGLSATFGDGKPISMKEMHQIREAIHKNMVFSRWQKGDVLILDNISTAHGRQPTYVKGRKIVVASILLELDCPKYCQQNCDYS